MDGLECIIVEFEVVSEFDCDAVKLLGGGTFHVGWFRFFITI